MSTPAWRAERAVLIARTISAKVAAVCPAGICRWDGVWELVEAPSNAFLDALAAWERSGSEDDKRSVQQAGAAVVDAWRQAAAEWQGRQYTQLTPEGRT